ncbi:MAG: phosphotransferase [Pseudomonadota bacterium]
MTRDVKVDPDDPVFRTRVESLTGASIEAVEFPGGKSRSTIRLLLSNGETVFATARRRSSQSTQELKILWALKKYGASCPHVVGVEEGFFLQSDVGSQRMSEALADATEAERFTLLNSALRSLASIHRALQLAGLSDELTEIGGSREARLHRTRLPLSLAEKLGLPKPDLNHEAIAERLAVLDDAAIKFDSRPANAIVGEGGAITWIDWDRAGRRNLADDLVCLFADEYMTHSPDTEEKLLGLHAQTFSGKRSLQDTQDYVRIAGCLHCCFRLELILKKFRENGRWSDAQKCLQKDRVGSSPEYVARLCQTGARWAGSTVETRNLEAFFAAMEMRFLEL